MPDNNMIKHIKLSPQQITDLQESKKHILGARKEVEIIKKLGMDVKMLEDKLTWAEEVSQTLLKEFGE